MSEKKRDRKNRPYRAIAMALAMLVLFGALVVKLYDLQLVQGASYAMKSENKKNRTIAISGSRGRITDVNGIPLAYDQKSYDVQFYRDPSKNKKDHRIAYTQGIIRTIELVEAQGGKLAQRLSLARNEAGEMVFDWGADLTDAQKARREELYRENMFLPASKYPDAQAVYEAMLERYYIPDDLPEAMAMKALAVWQEAQLNSYLAYLPVTIAKNVSMACVAQIEARSLDLPGMTISEGSVRVYPKGDTAAHIVGYLGRMTDEATLDAFMEQKGYPRDATIGVTGIEKGLEDALNGNQTDRQGQRVVEVNSQGKITRELGYTAPTNGNDVVLTLDLQLQQRLEDALARNVIYINEQQAIKREENAELYAEQEATRGSPLKTANSGAAVVLDIDTGRVLGMASYPSYDLTLFAEGISTEDFQAILDDPSKPLYNKAINGGTPGSIFKMATGIAALMEGAVTLDETIDDLGPYDKYIRTGKAPSCWIRPNYDRHKNENFARALKDSCNYYFYEVASRTGIDGLFKWADALGLNSATGLELPGEASSRMACQNLLYDPETPISEQKVALPRLVHSAIMQHIRDTAQSAGISYSDQAVYDAAEHAMQLIGQDDLNAKITQVLVDELDMSAALINKDRLDRQISDQLSEVTWDINKTTVAGIGQSVTTLTPIGVARYLAALLNGGRVLECHLVDSVVSPEGEVLERTEPVVVNQLDIPQEYLDAVKEGMGMTVQQEAGGTAGAVFADFKYKDQVGGKTGTAETSTVQLEDNAWFVAFAPFDEPEIAVVVFVPNGYSGSWASQAAREIIEYYLDSKQVTSTNQVPAENSLTQ